MFVRAGDACGLERECDGGALDNGAGWGAGLTSGERRIKMTVNAAIWVLVSVWGVASGLVFSVWLWHTIDLWFFDFVERQYRRALR